MNTARRSALKGPAPVILQGAFTCIVPGSGLPATGG